MMSKKGIWYVGTGKGDRVYINCTDESKIAHAHELCGNNGLCIYGYDNLRDLAIAILLLEKEKQKDESILNELNGYF